MKKHFFTLLLMCIAATSVQAGSVIIEGFEYGNHDLTSPIGWTCDDDSWLCGFLEKDHNRIPHSGNWYAFANADDAWMFMPMYLIPDMKYRINGWAISEGSVQLEFWAGSSAHAESMHTLLLTATVSYGAYERFDSYVETIPADCEYIAIHAVGQPGNWITIDDIDIEMVEQYSFEAEAITGHTDMHPGTEAMFHFFIHNTGYDPVDITANPSDEFFTNFSFHSNGISGRTFHTEPDEIVKVTVCATLRPEIEPGTVAWLDIQMTIPCNCNTALVTFWVTPLEITQVSENQSNVNIYPNPATDWVTIEAEELKHVDVVDLTGKTLSSHTAEGNSMLLNVSDLKPGSYFIVAKTRPTSSFVKPILKM